MWPLSCAITDMVHGVPYLYPIYTLSVLPLDFLDFCSPIYTLSILPLDFLDFLLTLSIPYLYFHWIFLIFCYPICTLSILYTFIVFSCFLLTLSIPYLYPICTLSIPIYSLPITWRYSVCSQSSPDFLIKTSPHELHLFIPSQVP